MNLKKTALAAAMTTALGVSGAASAIEINGTFAGLFTMIGPTGSPIANTDGASTMPWYTARTPMTGTMTFETDTGAGSGAFTPFSFFGKGLAAATTINFQAIGNGFGGPGSLVLANMGFNWNKNNGIPVSLVMDAAGFFGAVGGGLTTSDTVTGGALPASDGLVFGPGMASYTAPIGPVPMASTTWNTTTIGGAACTLGCNPSGTLGLSADTIGGTPMPAGPFAGFNANFDIQAIHIFAYSSNIPVPAAVWLFGSGLLGLIGVARRKKT